MTSEPKPTGVHRGVVQHTHDLPVSYKATPKPCMQWRHTPRLRQSAFSFQTKAFSKAHAGWWKTLREHTLAGNTWQVWAKLHWKMISGKRYNTGWLTTDTQSGCTGSHHGGPTRAWLASPCQQPAHGGSPAHSLPGPQHLNLQNSPGRIHALIIWGPLWTWHREEKESSFSSLWFIVCFPGLHAYCI